MRQVGVSLHDYIERHVQQDFKKNKKIVSSDGLLPDGSEEHAALAGRQVRGSFFSLSLKVW